MVLSSIQNSAKIQNPLPSANLRKVREESPCALLSSLILLPFSPSVPFPHPEVQSKSTSSQNVCFQGFSFSESLKSFAYFGNEHHILFHLFLSNSPFFPCIWLGPGVAGLDSVMVLVLMLVSLLSTQMVLCLYSKASGDLTVFFWVYYTALLLLRCLKNLTFSSLSLVFTQLLHF